MGGGAWPLSPVIGGPVYLQEMDGEYTNIESHADTVPAGGFSLSRFNHKQSYLFNNLSILKHIIVTSFLGFNEEARNRGMKYCKAQSCENVILIQVTK